MKKLTVRAFLVTAGLLAALNLGGCNNFFHELVPPDENRIQAFSVPDQIGAAEIGDYSIRVTVGPGADRAALVPSVQVPAKATLLPVTIPYIQKAFPSVNLFQEAIGFYTSADRANYAIDLIKANRDFNEPALDEAIDFSGPVNFLVVSALGNIRQYTVTVEVDTGETEFISFGFAKYDNPDLTRGDAAVILDNSAKTISAEAWYPVENIASYKLIPAFETNGARVTLDGVEITSGVTELDFGKPASASELPFQRQKTLAVQRPGFDPVNYTLTVTFNEDPDTNRSITDFRFNKETNYGINYTAMAEITNTGDTGTITVTAYYTGTPPAALTPSFTSPGTVSVEGAAQQSGLTPHNFSEPLFYKVVSRDGMYTRTYRVTVNLANEIDPRPTIDSFVFTTAANSALASNTSAMIDHNAGIIIIEAAYTDDPPPYTLTAEFSAGGVVSVDGITQQSGLSVQNFSRKIKYTVKDAGNPNLKRDYRAEVRFVKNSLSLADITDFFFYQADNPGLISDVTAVIDQAAGTIYAIACFDTVGNGHRTLVPRWLGHGTVTVGGVSQTSGVSGIGPSAVYRVRSADGAFYRDYTVTVLEINTRIYVNRNASGDNTGVSWANAFTSLTDAVDAAARLPAALACEVWIAEGVYRPSETRDPAAYYPISPNTGYIGGFGGTEARKADRTPAAHPVTISGDLGGGAYSRRLFMNSNMSGTNAAFEDLTFTKARATVGGVSDQYGPAIYVREYGVITITRAVFEDTQTGSDGGAVYASSSAGSVTITGSHFEHTQTGIGGRGGAVFASSSAGSVTITGSSFVNTQAGSSGGAVYAYSSAGSITITDSHFEHTQTGNNTGGGAVVASSSSGSISISNSGFEDTQAGTSGGAVYASSYDGSISISKSSFVNTRAKGYSGGAVCAEFYRTTGSLNISDSTFKDTQAGTSGGAVYASHFSTLGFGSVTITDSRFNTIRAGGSGGAVYAGGSVTIANSTFNDTKIIGADPGNGNGGAVYIYLSFGAKVSIIGGSITNSRAVNSVENSGIFCGGGGIFIEGNTTGSAAISGVNFNGVQALGAGTGGAVAFSRVALTMANCSIANAAAAQFGGAIGGVGPSSCRLDGIAFSTCDAPQGTILYGNKYGGIDGAPAYTVGPGCSVGGETITIFNWTTALQPSMLHLINGAGITPSF